MLLGSFVMAVIHFVRLLLEYLRQLKSQNSCLNFIAFIAICLIDCCRQFWDMLSQNAYYLIAMFGLPFCSAQSLSMELTSLGLTALFYIVGNIMVNIGVALVMVGSTLLTLWAVDYNIEEDKMWTAYIVCGLVAMIISAVILTVYSVKVLINIIPSSIISLHPFVSSDNDQSFIRLCLRGYSSIPRTAFHQSSCTCGLLAEDSNEHNQE